MTIIKLTNGLSIKNSEEKNSISNLNIDNNFKLSSGPIYARGWLKFNKSLKDQTGKETGFLKNKFFEEQFKGDASVDLSVEDNVI